MANMTERVKTKLTRSTACVIKNPRVIVLVCNRVAYFPVRFHAPTLGRLEPWASRQPLFHPAPL